MKNVTFSALIAASLIGITACSDKEDDIPVSGNQIRFNVTVPAASREATTTQSIKDFSIWSFVNGKEYMSQVQASRSGSSWTTSPVMYWPADGSAVNFYCISPVINSPGLGRNEGNYDIKGYTNTDGTVDLLYAVTIGATQGANRNPVNINFRHALSKLAFNFKRREASSTQAPLKVDVSEVSITSIASKGSFSYPDVTTVPNSDTTGLGKWGEQSEPKDIIIYKGEAQPLTDTYAGLNSTGYEFAIPQNLSESQADYQGAYVKVLCSVYDENSGVRIWPAGAEADYLYFPLNDPGKAKASTWEAGKAYVYNITIGVPESSGKIEFDITVDEYNNFNNTEL